MSQKFVYSFHKMQHQADYLNHSRKIESLQLMNYRIIFILAVCAMLRICAAHAQSISASGFITTGSFLYSDSINGSSLIQPTYKILVQPVVEEESRHITSLDASPESNASYEIRVYPNPFTESVTINIKTEVCDLQVDVYNMLGNKVARIVFSEPSNRAYEIQIDLSSLPTGVYVLKANYTENGKSNESIQKLIKH